MNTNKTDWVEFAKAIGKTTEKEFFEYVYERGSIRSICNSLGISSWYLRKKLDEHGIAVRLRGGARRKSLEITQEIANRVPHEGIANVAKSLGISRYTLWKKLAQLRKATAMIPELPSETLSASPLAPDPLPEDPPS
jgi:DNA-binding protein Fis